MREAPSVISRTLFQEGNNKKGCTSPVRKPPDQPSTRGLHLYASCRTRFQTFVVQQPGKGLPRYYPTHFTEFYTTPIDGCPEPSSILDRASRVGSLQSSPKLQTGLRTAFRAERSTSIREADRSDSMRGVLPPHVPLDRSPLEESSDEPECSASPRRRR